MAYLDDDDDIVSGQGQAFFKKCSCLSGPKFPLYGHFKYVSLLSTC
jgi:hypothetical protein